MLFIKFWREFWKFILLNPRERIFHLALRCFYLSEIESIKDKFTSNPPSEIRYRLILHDWSYLLLLSIIVAVHAFSSSFLLISKELCLPLNGFSTRNSSALNFQQAQTRWSGCLLLKKVNFIKYEWLKKNYFFLLSRCERCTYSYAAL